MVSGGHTMIIYIKKYNNINLIEESQDDGMGEVFDKIARALKIKPYNGNTIEKLAKKMHILKITREEKKKNRKNNQKLSFSGIKTNTLNQIKNSQTNKNEICYIFQTNLIKIILQKSKNLVTQYNIKNLILAGGVASNKEFRISLKEYITSINGKTYYIPKKYCTDNGGMIAFLAFIKSYEGCKDENLKIKTYQDLKINQ